MLSLLGKLGKTFVAKILFGLLTLSMVAWGISDVFRSTSANDAARVGKIKISMTELEQSYRQYLGNLRARGMNISPEQAQSMQIAESVLKSRVQRKLFTLASQDMGLNVSDAVTADEIRKQKMFQDDTGKFDRTKFNMILKQNRLRESDYVQNMRLDTANNLVLAALKNSVVIPDVEVGTFYQYQNETRSADIRILPFDAAKDVASPTDEQLGVYLKANQDKYKVPELRSFTVAMLSLENLAKSVDVSDAEIETEYNNRKDDFKAPEERDFQFVSLPDQKMAQKVAEAARGGDNLLASARAHGAADAKLENLKSVKQGTLPAELERTVFSLGRAETSDAIQTPLGWYVVQILNIKKSDVPPLKQMHDKIRHAIQMTKADASLSKLTTNLDDAVAGGASLEELAKNYPLQLTEVRDAEMASEKMASKEALKAAFSLEAKQTSALQELPGSNSMLVRLNDIKLAHVPELPAIKKQLTADWTQEKKIEITKARAEELRKAWAGNQNFDDLGRKYNTQSAMLNGVKRDSKDSNVSTSPDLVPAVFDLKKAGDVAIGNVKNGIAVARLSSINKAAAAKPENLTALQTQLQEQKQETMFNAFLQNAEKKYKVTINQSGVRRLYQTAN